MEKLTEKFYQHCMHNYKPLPINIKRGEGSILYDNSGKDYIDFAAGIAVTSLGHNHPQLKAALTEAMGGVWHLSNYFTSDYAVNLAEKICNNSFADKVFFCNSGTEANEAAFKLARKYGRDNYGEHKTNIVSCNNAFHGRSLFTVSVGGQAKYSEPFAPLPSNINHIEFNNCDELEAAIDDNCCAFVVEPIQGESGVIPASVEFMKKARELCNRHNALLIFDEIQCGMGRTAHLYDYMFYDVEPDVLTSAKALGCGIPIGAMLMKESVSSVLAFGTHGSTFGGNPLACAVANKAFDIISNKDLLYSVHKTSDFMFDELKNINDRLGVFSEIRGRGLLIGCKLNEKYQHMGRDIIQKSLEEGVVLLGAGGGDVLRFAPSLIIKEKDLVEGLARLEKSLSIFKEAHENS